jgi:hypothetical protein
VNAFAKAIFADREDTISGAVYCRGKPQGSTTVIPSKGNNIGNRATSSVAVMRFHLLPLPMSSDVLNNLFPAFGWEDLDFPPG